MPVIKTVVEKPRGKVVLVQSGSDKIKAEIEWNESFVQRFNRQFNAAQAWLDNRVLRDSNYYAPMRTGALKKTGILGTTAGEGVVQWVAPYAHRLYYGTHLNISKAYNPNAQSFWFEAAKSQNKQEWINGVKRIAGGG